MKKPVKIGVCGLGMGKSHAYAAHILEQTELVAIAEMNPESFKMAKDKLNERKGNSAGDFFDSVQKFSDYKDMITDGNIDAMVIALPTHMHTEASIFALNHGVHVLCEKPPTVTVDEMIQVYDKVKETGLTYAFARQSRFNPSIQSARKIIATGALGDVYHAESKWNRTGGIPFRKGYGVNKETGGGVLLDLGIHAIDNAWYAMGCPRPTEVMSIMHCTFSHLGDAENLEVPYTADDMTQGLIRFENGASLTFNVNFILNTSGQPNRTLKKAGKNGWQEIYIFGDKAGVDLYNNKLINRENNSMDVTAEDLKMVPLLKHGTMEAQMADFANAIATNTQPQNTVEQAVMLMQMLDALFKSAELKKSITIENMHTQLITA
ncbi:MAG: hypothetical protein COA79_09410 [Planctomycetota bacterium]|nr:MAG: hypothetical protein COA79_09410 [Planctomycetota bacterium]